MTFPIQMAIFGAAAVITLYLMFRDQRNNQRQLEYGHGGRGGGSPETRRTYIPPAYDTHPLRRRNSSASVKKDCIICLSELDSGSRQESSTSANRMLRCGHVFHAGCIKTWLREARECPICRQYAS